MLRQFAIFISSAILFWSSAALTDTPSVPGAKAYIISPKDGDVVSNPIRVQFGLEGMGIAPAGIDAEGTGHHHLVVDKDTPDLSDYLPTGDSQVIHFGKGQTETTLSLEPGEHTLQLVLGDKDHKPHVPPVVSNKVTITVK
jgi:hypothetical protein